MEVADVAIIINFEYTIIHLLFSRRHDAISHVSAWARSSAASNNVRLPERRLDDKPVFKKAGGNRNSKPPLGSNRGLVNPREWKTVSRLEPGILFIIEGKPISSQRSTERAAVGVPLEP
jgi:hypothetical protein